MSARRILVALLLFLLVAAGAVVTYRMADRRESAPDIDAVVDELPRRPAKVVVIGLDGADWQVIDPLLQAGKMPALASLIDGGARGTLMSQPPTLSPSVWTTMMTGVGPDAHGIRDFVFKEPGTYSQPAVRSTNRERLALWNILSRLGLTVGVVDWYATWPAETVRGFVVADRYATSGLDADGVTFPPYDVLKPELDKAVRPDETRLPALAAMREGFEVFPRKLEEAVDGDLDRFGLARALYRSQQPDFFAFYLKSLDAAGHFYWKHYRPNDELYGPVDPGERALLGKLLPLTYQLNDQLLGLFLDGLDDETNVLVVSDHGFTDFARPDTLIFDLDRLFEAMGLLQFEDPALAGDRTARRIRMAETRLYAHEGTVIVSAFGTRERPVYLNIAGRDPEGVLDAEAWREERDAIVDELRGLRTDLGTKIFAEVRVHEGRFTSQQEPDLYLRADREIAFDYHVLVGERKVPLLDHLLWEYGDINGSHRLEGIVVARGPAVRAGADVGSPSLIDVAPTILRLFGAPVPQDFEGRAIAGLFADPDAAHPLKVASYEALIERLAVRPPDEQLDEEYREKLRSLGYLQ